MDFVNLVDALDYFEILCFLMFFFNIRLLLKVTKSTAQQSILASPWERGGREENRKRGDKEKSGEGEKIRRRKEENKNNQINRSCWLSSNQKLNRLNQEKKEEEKNKRTIREQKKRTKIEVEKKNEKNEKRRGKKEYK